MDMNYTYLVTYQLYYGIKKQHRNPCILQSKYYRPHVCNITEKVHSAKIKRNIYGLLQDKIEFL